MSPPPLDSVSMSSDATRTASEEEATRGLAAEGGGQKEDDPEKVVGREKSGGGLSGNGHLERDSDGVLVEDGVPIVRMNGPDDPDSYVSFFLLSRSCSRSLSSPNHSPLNLSNARKWAIVIVITSASFCITCCSSMSASTFPFPSLPVG